METNCMICGKEIKIQPKRIRRLKQGVIACSRECSAKHRSEYMKGSGNHQYGLSGSANASFKGDTVISSYGYVLEYCPGHPRPHDAATREARVKQHRLVVERNHTLFNPDFFEKVNDWVVLKEQYDVHHKDEDRKNNKLENLEVLTRSQHSIHHNKGKVIIRDSKTGRIKGVFKSRELLETPEEDNQQPSHPVTDGRFND